MVSPVAAPCHFLIAGMALAPMPLQLPTSSPCALAPRPAACCLEVPHHACRPRLLAAAICCVTQALHAAGLAPLAKQTRGSRRVSLPPRQQCQPAAAARKQEQARGGACASRSRWQVQPAVAGGTSQPPQRLLLLLEPLPSTCRPRCCRLRCARLLSTHVRR